MTLKFYVVDWGEVSWVGDSQILDRLKSSLWRQFIKIMLKASSLPRSTKPGRIFEINPLSDAEFKQRQLEARYRLDKAWVIFQRIKPNLRKRYFEWYIAIDPDTGVYFLDSTYTGVCLRSQIYFPTTILCIYQLNESGLVGRE